MRKTFILFIVLLFGCATSPQKPDESYYEALAEKSTIENTIIDDNTYYGITLYKEIDFENYRFIGIDEDCRCKKYIKIKPGDIFDSISVYTDMDDRSLKIVLFKEFSTDFQRNRFFGDIREALQTKYPKLKPLGKDIYEHYTVRFTDDKEQYKKQFIQRKKMESSPYYTFELLEGDYYRDNEMIHPALNTIDLSTIKKIIISPTGEEYPIRGVSLSYRSKRYWKVYEEGSKQRKKEAVEKFKGL